MSIELKQEAQRALEALEEIALAGMSGTGQESEEGMRDWHARQAWKLIGIAARALDPLRAAIQQAEAQQAEVTDEEIDYAVLQTVGFDGMGTQEMNQFDCRNIARAILALRPGDVLYTHPAPGAPVGQAPSVWNSIQIASWIGSQLMHEPSLFERNAVCKFVRSLGRHPTLLKHSPKDTNPAPGEPDDVVRDAERYRWLKDRNNKAQTGVGRWESDDHFTWLCDLDADAAIDAARAAEKGGE